MSKYFLESKRKEEGTGPNGPRLGTQARIMGMSQPEPRHSKVHIDRQLPVEMIEKRERQISAWLGCSWHVAGFALGISTAGATVPLSNATFEDLWWLYAGCRGCQSQICTQRLSARKDWELRHIFSAVWGRGHVYIYLSMVIQVCVLLKKKKQLVDLFQIKDIRVLKYSTCVGLVFMQKAGTV